MKMVEIPKKTDEEMAVGYDGDSPQYPYGTELDIRDELVDQSGVGDLEVGDEVMVMAKARVSRKNENSHQREGEEKETNREVSLQLTEIGVSKDGEKPDRAGQLYEGD